MKDEYIIVNRTAIQKRIEELENNIKNIRETGGYDFKSEDKLEELKRFLSQSTPLIPEIEKALYTKGAWYEDEITDYISNLKLNI